MKVGGFPSREAALREEMERRRRVSRRALLGASTAFLAAGAIGGYALSPAFAGEARKAPSTGEPGSQDPPATTKPKDAELEWARKVATGPLRELLEAKYTFLSTVELKGPQDPVLCYGVSRLGHAVVDAEARPDKRLATVLMMLGRSGKMASHLDPLFDHVRRVSRGRAK